MEVQVAATQTGSTPLPTAYTGCHAHGTDLWCMTPDGGEVEVLQDSTETTPAADEGDAAADSEGENCHFHAGVE